LISYKNSLHPYIFYRVAGLTQPVLGGLLVKGAIAPGTRLLVGPLPDGEFSPVKVVSLHRNKAPCCLVRASQSASLTLAPPTNRSPPLPHLRPGMVLVSLRDRPHATLFFQVCERASTQRIIFVLINSIIKNFKSYARKKTRITLKRSFLTKML